MFQHPSLALRANKDAERLPMYDEENTLAEDELVREFDLLFPQGFDGADVLREIAPEGWEKSPWYGRFGSSNDPFAHEISQPLRDLETWKPGDPLPVFPTMDDYRGKI